MEDLTQTQVILLCLLVSFVTSIGTGVITTSLLQQAPQNVTQTINRVVERTVETIVPQENSKPNVITRETTVVVKEEDLVIDAIKASRANLVWIIDGDEPTSGAVRSIGVVVKADGTILTDKRYITGRGEYSAKFFAGGEVYPVTTLAVSRTSNAVYLKPDFSKGSTRTFTPSRIADARNIQLGQTVIAMGGRDKEAVSIGRATGLSTQTSDGKPATATSTAIVIGLQTDTPLIDLTPGSILLNLNGDLVGFESYSPTGNESTYTTMNLFKNEHPELFQ